MKMKIVDAIRKASDDDIAKIIGAVVAQHIDGISAEEAIKLDYPNTLKELQSEIEIDYKQTNADRIRSMSDEELADFLMDVGMGSLFDKKIMNVKTWLQSEVEE